MIRTSEIPASEFSDILQELTRWPLPLNTYRLKSGSGMTQTFGIVNRRCLPPDYSRLCWQRPQLYKMLIDFGSKHVSIPYTSITVNCDYKALPHKDKGNIGLSYLVAFGNYEGGELQMLEGDDKGEYDIKHKGLIADFAATLHGVKEFKGNRYSLVFYTAKKSSHLPAPSVIIENGSYLFKRGDEIITTGLDHPLKGKKKALTFAREYKDVSHTFE